MSIPGNLCKPFLIMVAAAILFSAGSASAVEKPRPGAAILLESYHRNVATLETNGFGIPLVVQSSEQDDRVHVDVYGIFQHPFGSVATVLKSPADWCDIVSLFPNVKAATHRDLPDGGQLTLYLGRKVYQPPEDARQIVFRFRNAGQQQGYLDIRITADEGPYGTKNHMIRVEAIPIDGSRTFIHVSYAYSDSNALRLAAKIYFATLGRSKVGFTITDTDENDRPVYLGGPRGAVERNAVRCYFAIQSYMNTLHYPEDSRFSMRISQWYDLTTHYRKQLYDLERKDYLEYKRAEHVNQLTLQRRIGMEIR
jgi:hypothetical protein